MQFAVDAVVVELSGHGFYVEARSGFALFLHRHEDPCAPRVGIERHDNGRGFSVFVGPFVMEVDRAK